MSCVATGGGGALGWATTGAACGASEGVVAIPGSAAAAAALLCEVDAPTAGSDAAAAGAKAAGAEGVLPAAAAAVLPGPPRAIMDAAPTGDLTAGAWIPVVALELAAAAAPVPGAAAGECAVMSLVVEDAKELDADKLGAEKVGAEKVGADEGAFVAVALAEASAAGPERGIALSAWLVAAAVPARVSLRVEVPEPLAPGSALSGAAPGAGLVAAVGAPPSVLVMVLVDTAVLACCARCWAAAAPVVAAAAMLAEAAVALVALNDVAIPAPGTAVVAALRSLEE